MTCVAAPKKIDLCRRRGDTFADIFTLKDSAGVAIDISSGYSFLLTVDPSESPVNSDNNLFQLTGVIVDGPNGKVSFAPSAVQSDQPPATYFYDIQQTLSGVVRTIVVGEYDIVQDITK